MFRMIRFLLRNSRLRVILAILTGVLGGAASAGLIALVNLKLAAGAEGRLDLLWIFIGVALLLPVARFLSGYLLTDLSQKAIMDLRLELSRRILAARLRQLEEVGAPRLLAALTEDVMAIAEASASLPFFSMQLAILVGCLAFLAWLSLPVFVAVFLFLVIAVVILRTAESTASGAFRMARETQDALFKGFQSLTQGNKELKLHNRRQRAFLGRILQPAAGSYRQHQVAGRTIYNLVGSLSQLLFFGLLGLILFALPRFHAVETSVQMGYIITILYIVGPIETIMTGLLPGFARARIALQKVESLGLSLEAAATERPVDASAEPLRWQSLELAGVTHVYRRESEDGSFILGPIDMSLHPGELVFLVGGNGSGKTTLAKLITGLYVPEQGELRLDGETITDENRDGYRQLFSVVFSDFHLFDTLLGLDSPEIDARAENYLRDLQLQDKVKVVDGALSTTELSQGQRKRLALLTAYLEDRPTYLFDEWAADQDPEFKEVFYHALLPELKARGKTVLVISHDDRYYDLADRIIKLESGRLVYDRAGLEDRAAEMPRRREMTAAS